MTEIEAFRAFADLVMDDVSAALAYYDARRTGGQHVNSVPMMTFTEAARLQAYATGLDLRRIDGTVVYGAASDLSPVLGSHRNTEGPGA